MGGKSLESKKPTVPMIAQCRERGLPDPIWTSDEKLGVIEMTVPDKPQSPFQMYRLTAAGKRLISRDQTVVVVAKKAKATRHEPVTDKVGQA